MSRGPNYTAEESQRLLAIRDDMPEARFTEVADKALAYGIIKGRTRDQIADKLSRLLDERGRASGMTLQRQTPEDTQVEMVVVDRSAALLERIANSLDRLEALMTNKEANR